MYQLRPDHNAVLDRAGFSVSWQFDAQARINGGLAVAGDTVYVGTFGGKVIALNLLDGTQRWETTLDNVVMSTPVVADGLVFVGTGHNGAPGAPSHGGFAYASDTGAGLSEWGRVQGDHVVALNAADGSRAWAYHTDGEDMPSPAYIDGRLVFANGDFHAYALNATSGDAAWRQDMQGIATMASATVVADRRAVLLASCRSMEGESHTFLLDAATGTVKWRAPYGDCDASPAYADGRVFVAGVRGLRQSFGFGGRSLIAALDADSGRALWTYRSASVGLYTELASNERAIAGTYADGTYFQSIPTDDRIVAFNATNGTIRWQFHTTAPVKMSPVVQNGLLYAGDTAGVLYAIGAATGQLVNVKLYDEPFSTSPPVIVGNTMIVANGTTVYALALTD